MKKTVSQIAKEFYRNYRRTDWSGLPHWLTPALEWHRGNGTFFYRNSWRDIEDSGQANSKNPFNLWAHAHTLSVEDEVITITRDEDNNVSQHTYQLDSFNTICVKNLDEARKIENNRGLFGGLYVVDYSTKKVYRLVAKINNKVRLERIMNTYVTQLPWFFGKTKITNRPWRQGFTPQRIEEAFDGVLDTTNLKPYDNGY